MPSMGEAVRVAIAAVLLLLGLATSSPADDIPLALPASTPASRTIEVPDTGLQYVVNLLRSNVANPPKVTIYATDFIGVQGDSLAVKLRLPDSQTPPSDKLADISLSDPLLRLLLVIPRLPNAGIYAGSLIITAPDKNAMVINLALEHPTPARPATMVVSPQAVSIQATESIFFDDDPSTTITLRDKAGQVAIRGFYAEVESVTRAPGGHIDIGRNLILTPYGIGATPAGILSRLGRKVRHWYAMFRHPEREEQPSASKPCRAAASAPGDGHVTLLMRLVNPEAGEYDATLRFHAANSVDDDAQKFHFVADIKHSVWWAFLALAAALSFSFVGTKLVSFRRQSLELQQQVASLNAPWLKEQSAGSVAAVYAQAILSQCDELTKRFWLSSANIIEDLLKSVKDLIAVLDKARQIAADISRMNQPPSVEIRARHALRHIIDDMGVDCLGAETIAKAKSRLEGFSDWLSPDRIGDAFWKDLYGSIEQLVAKVDTESSLIPGDSAKTRIKELHDALKKAPPATIAEKIARETDYAKLKILWDWKSEEEFSDLLAKAGGTGADALFAAVDDAVWKRIKALGGKIVADIRFPTAPKPIRQSPM